MAKHKTVFVWILLVLLSLWVLNGIWGIVQLIMGDFSSAQFAVLPPFISLAFSVAITAIMIVYIVKLYNVRPDVIRWTHIMFGISIIGTIASVVLTFLSTTVRSPLMIYGFVLLVTLCMWAGITMHLNRATRDNLMEFS